MTLSKKSYELILEALSVYSLNVHDDMDYQEEAQEERQREITEAEDEIVAIGTELKLF